MSQATPPAPARPPGGGLPPALAELQASVEASFLAAKTLEAEAARLASLHPVLCVRPARPSRIMRALGRVPGLGRRRALEDLRRSGLLDAAWYLARNPDVAAAGVEPARHYLDRGAAEMRDPGPHFSTRHYVEIHSDIRDGGVNPLLHYVRAGWQEGRSIRPGMAAQPGRDAR